ncbi:MAG: hypothetical protein JXD22_15685 [Sedimentisphaerales bacterium]|nr:hypothetical protein [Sedimentisphaerales bacterium]
MGIFALPYMVEKCGQGDESMAKFISGITRNRNIISKTTRKCIISPNASKKDVLDWWEKDKNKWTVKIDKSKFKKNRSKP